MNTFLINLLKPILNKMKEIPVIDVVVLCIVALVIGWTVGIVMGCA